MDKMSSIILSMESGSAMDCIHNKDPSHDVYFVYLVDAFMTFGAKL